MSLQMKFEDVLPPLSSEEFEALAADVKANGVLNPVLIDEDGVILDGHHRYKIDKKAPTKTLRGLTEEEKIAFVYRSNFSRRNLSHDQRRDLLKKMKTAALRWRTVDPHRWTQRRIGEALGVSQQCVAIWLKGEAKPTTNTNTCNGGTSAATQPPASQASQDAAEAAEATPSPQRRMDARVKLSEKDKQEIARLCNEGVSQKQIAADYKVSQQTVSKIFTQFQKAQEKEARAAEATKAAEKIEDDRFLLGDFRSIADGLSDNCFDLVFTDPPYDRKSLQLYIDAAAVAERVLKPGGSLVMYCGQYLVADILGGIADKTSMRLWWINAVMHTGQLARMTEYGIVVHWKPLLWYVKGTRKDKRTFVDDLVAGKQEKSHHEWQQSLIEAAYYIERLSPKGGAVFDPFCGGGTTAAACASLGRHFVTCDINKKSLAAAKIRVNGGVND